MVPRRYAVVLPAYLAALLAIDTQVGLHVQLALGAVTFAVLAAALRALPPLVRAQAIGVVLFATLGEVTGSLVWGVYHYRLHNLPLFIPPAHGLVYLSGVALSRRVRARAVVWAAAIGAAAWGIAGLTLLPRIDIAGAFGVPLLLVFLWRSRSRATYAGVFLAVGALELYGTSIGTWRWAHDLPGLGIPDGNPPSGVASGYVWFDVMALLVAPWLVYASGRAEAETLDSLIGRLAQLDPPERADRNDERVGRVVARVGHVERHHPEPGLGLDPLQNESRGVGELDFDERLLDAVRLGKRGDRLVEPLDERLVRQLGVGRPEVGHALTLARDADLDEAVHHLVKRARRVELVCAGGPQQRLDGADMRTDQLPLERGLAEVVRRARRDPVEENLGRSAEQHDGVEAVVETSLIRDRPGHVERWARIGKKPGNRGPRPTTCRRPRSPPSSPIRRCRRYGSRAAPAQQVRSTCRSRTCR